jgi:hypothetical protein
MTISRRWVLPLAIAGGMAIGAAFTMRRRDDRRRAERQSHKEDVHAWEGEGGSLAAPATARCCD